MEEKTKSKNIIRKLLLFFGISSAISSAVAAGAVITAPLNENSFYNSTSNGSAYTQETTNNTSYESVSSEAGARVLNAQEVFNSENDSQSSTAQNPDLDEALEDAATTPDTSNLLESKNIILNQLTNVINNRYENKYSLNEVENLLNHYLSEKYGIEINYELNSDSSLENILTSVDSQTKKYIEKHISNYKLIILELQQQESLEQGNSANITNPGKETNKYKVDKIDEINADKWAIIAALSAGASVVTVTGAVLLKRSLKRGKEARKIGTGKRSGILYNSKKLSRLEKKIEKTDLEIEKL